MLAGELGLLPYAVFGLASGFFYLPAAVNEEWSAGLPVEDLLQTLALGHCYFAFQDQVIDEGGATPALCLASHEALLGYLTSCGRFLGDHNALLELHRRQYRTYTRALSVELAHRQRHYEWTTSEVAGLGRKAAPGNVVLEIIAARAGRHSASRTLCRAVGILCAAFQLLDDLNDVEHDTRNGNATVPIDLLIARLADADVAPSDLAGKETVALLAATGVSAAVRRTADVLLVRAQQLAEEAGSEIVHALANVWQQRNRVEAAAAARGVDNFLAGATNTASP